MTSLVLGLDDDDPICGRCARAIGGRLPRSDGYTPAAFQRCAHCSETRVCVKVYRHTWPGAAEGPPAAADGPVGGDAHTAAPASPEPPGAPTDAS